MTLQDGDQIWVTKRDGARERGWAIWHRGVRDGLTTYLPEGYFQGPCGMIYTPLSLKIIVRNWHDHAGGFERNYHCMAEQLIAEGAL